MTKYLNFFEFESGFTEAVEAGQLFFPNVSYTEEDDTVHWNLTQPVNPVETPMLRMHFSTSTPGQRVALLRNSGADNAYSGITALEIDGTPVNFSSGGTYTIAEPGNHTAVYQFASHKITPGLFDSESGAFDTFTSAEITSAVTLIGFCAFKRCGGLTGVSIPDSVTKISVSAFAGSGLRSVTIPDSVTTLDGFPFFGCTEMRTATVGSGVTAILDQTFGECTSLQSVTLPGNLTVIGEEAFLNCHSLRDINIPSGVTTIGERAFVACSGLTAIYLNPETPPSLGANALDYTNECPIYVPAASVETYKQSWSAYASRIKTKYNISASVNDDSLGEVNLGQETAPEGAQVGFNVDVFEMDRYQVSSVSITDGNGDEVECTNDWDNHYSFTMPASDVTISVVIGEKPKHAVTVNSTDNMVTDINFNSDDGEPSFPEDNYASFNFHLPEELQLVSAQASDCDGNSIEVEVEDGGDGYYSCYFTMPGCDVSVFITVEEKPKYNISASVNDSSLGAYGGPDSAPEGGQVEFDVFVFRRDMYQVSSVSITDGNGDEVEYTDDGDGDYSFTMPASDVTIFVTIEANTRPRYNISASVNDDSLGRINLHQDIALEGDYVEFDVIVFDPDANHVSSVTCRDGNGSRISCLRDFDEGGRSRYHFNKMPASDVTIKATIEPKQ